MKKAKKSCLLIILVLAMLWVLVGCGKGAVSERITTLLADSF